MAFENEAVLVRGEGPLAYPTGACVPGKYGPGLPIHIMAVLLVHVFPETVHIGTRQSNRELQELVREQQGPDAESNLDTDGKRRDGWASGVERRRLPRTVVFIFQLLDTPYLIGPICPPVTFFQGHQEIRTS